VVWKCGLVPAYSFLIDHHVTPFNLHTQRVRSSDLFDQNWRSELRTVKKLSWRPLSVEQVKHRMSDRGSFFVPSICFPRPKGLLAAEGGCLKNIGTRIPSCVDANRFQQATLACVIFPNKQVQPPQLRQREIAEELETGDV
jgi:hypothetical protein